MSRQVYEESRTRGWPGLGEEVTDICKEIGIPDVNREVVSKSVIKEAIWKHQYADIKKELSTSKKLKDIKDDDFSEVQEYFKGKSVENTRMAFKVRCQMVADIPANFKNKYKKKEEGLECSYCAEKKEMSQGHCLECPAWSELRIGLDVTNIMDLVVFFRRLLTERARMEEKGVTKTASHDSM